MIATIFCWVSVGLITNFEDDVVDSGTDHAESESPVFIPLNSFVLLICISDLDNDADAHWTLGEAGITSQSPEVGTPPLVDPSFSRRRRRCCCERYCLSCPCLGPSSVNVVELE